MSKEEQTASRLCYSLGVEKASARRHAMTEAQTETRFEAKQSVTTHL